MRDTLADIWDAVAVKRLDRGDVTGAMRAVRAANLLREVQAWGVDVQW